MDERSLIDRKKRGVLRLRGTKWKVKSGGPVFWEAISL